MTAGSFVTSPQFSSPLALQQLSLLPGALEPRGDLEQQEGEGRWMTWLKGCGGNREDGSQRQASAKRALHLRRPALAWGLALVLVPSLYKRRYKPKAQFSSCCGGSGR